MNYKSLQGLVVSTENLLHNLSSPDVASLTATLLNAPIDRDVLIYLWYHPQMALTMSDLASQMEKSEVETTSALNNLKKLGLILEQNVCGTSFYRLTSSETKLNKLEKFIVWRANWLTHIQQLEAILGSPHL